MSSTMGLLASCSSPSPSLCDSSAAAAAHHHPKNKCHASGILRGPKSGHVCGECCRPGHFYPTYQCWPLVSTHTKTVMTLNDFSEGKTTVAARRNATANTTATPSASWHSPQGGTYYKDKRCHKHIRIHARDRSVLAKFVDECDSLHGCDREHTHLVNASKAA
ncbi:hypothetical protein U9M48_022664 [Paspalum notatum var. saurae]|uniref:Secreted protein n=1 Tax=Paspalum notatum var. saurae TaxID=547442 RepID=A0AAQ3WUY3_PASNO